MSMGNLAHICEKAKSGEGRRLRVSTGHKSLGRAKNRNWTWQELIERLKEPVRSQESMKEYLRMAKSDQDRLKNVGFFVCGHCDNGIRRKDSIHERDLIALDLDEATSDLLLNLDLGSHDLAGFEFVAYSTRKHTPENPRIRIVVPLTRGISPEEHHALSRIVSYMVDDTMDSVDPVSFRMSQVMYFPSVCRDGEFYWHHNEGHWLNPSQVLDAFGDWQDHTKLPYSEARGEAKALVTKKVEDPTEKRGLVGAFCRVYDVPSAIEKFLPDVYIPGDEGRYSYANGSTSNGAILYDDDKILYSNHSTDPAGERSQNAFDLVRIHLFGHLDDDVDSELTSTQTPSYKEMETFLAGDSEVQKEFRKNHLPDLTDEDFDEYDEIEIPKKAAASSERSSSSEESSVAEDSRDWVELLDVDKEGRITKCLDNIVVIMQNDPRLRGVVRKNLFRSELAACKRLADLRIQNRRDGDVWSDSHDHRLRHILEKPVQKGGYGMTAVPKADIVAAADIVAMENGFHPVRDYLESLEWDGESRLDTWMINYLGAEDSSYTRAVSRKFLCAAVARVFVPGVKFDQVVILEGAQGIRKSSLVATLSRGWFAELISGFEDPKKFVENARDAWLIEVPELSGFSKSEVTQLKGFFSRTHDACRLAYATRAATFPRQCVFIGTTNEKDYLRDATGNRRYWPVQVNTDWIDLEKLEGEVDQLWAEAKVRWDAGEPLWLEDDGAREIAEAIQSARVEENEVDGMIGVIQAWLDKPARRDRYDDQTDADFDFGDEPEEEERNRVCLLEIWVDCLGSRAQDYSSMEARKLSKAMGRVAGWKKHGTLLFGSRFGKQKSWVRVK